MAIVKKWIIAHVGGHVEKLKPSYVAGMHVKWCNCGKQQFLKKVKHKVTI